MAELLEFFNLVNSRLYLSLYTFYCHPSLFLDLVLVQIMLCRIPFARTTFLQHSFMQTVIPLWNHLATI